MTAREAPRVAFASLIERGMISAGAKLVDAKKKHRVLVRADGAVTLGDAVGSIHQMGALAQGLDACNGWTFWHLETPKGLVSIDALARRDQRRDGGSLNATGVEAIAKGHRFESTRTASMTGTTGAPRIQSGYIDRICGPSGSSHPTSYAAIAHRMTNSRS